MTPAESLGSAHPRMPTWLLPLASIGGWLTIISPS
jgi:hypothetical protein